MTEPTYSPLPVETASSTDLGRRVGNGLAWSLANNIVSRAGSFLLSILIARILLPEDFGVFAVSLVVLNVMLSMNELGVSLALIRSHGPVAPIAATVSTISIGFSALLCLAGLWGAPLIAGALNAPLATGVIRLLAVCVLIDGLAAVPQALNTRAFQQRRRLVIDVSAFLVSTPVTIALAVTGHGAWSLALGLFVGNVVSAALTFALVSERYRPGFDRAVAQELLSFGLPLAGASLLLFAMLNVDYVIVSRVLGVKELGFYVLAFNLCAWPVMLVSTAIRRVSLVGFSRMAEQGPAEVEQGFRLAAKLVLAIALPMCLLLAIYPGPLVSFLYGDKWSPAASVIPALAILGLARVGVELSYDYLVATNRTKENLWLHAVWFLALIPTLAIAANWLGIRGVAIGHGLVVVAVVFPLLAVILHRSGVRLLQMVVDVKWVALGGALLVISVLPVRLLVRGALWEMLVGGVIGSCLYAAVVARDVRCTSKTLLARGGPPTYAPPSATPRNTARGS